MSIHSAGMAENLGVAGATEERVAALLAASEGLPGQYPSLAEKLQGHGHAQLQHRLVGKNGAAVEMTEEGKSQNQEPGFPFFLGKRKQRVSHIPTARVLLLLR